jgi:hypothetical protein
VVVEVVTVLDVVVVVDVVTVDVVVVSHCAALWAGRNRQAARTEAATAVALNPMMLDTLKVPHVAHEHSGSHDGGASMRPRLSPSVQWTGR